ncbi:MULTISPECIES: DoxX family protein [Lysobacter]|uniref:DoxX family protein n=1 Tax=Lysobacter TaxID=68 RepID=UPI001F45896B|nr:MULTISPECIES: DoxX family protein [Lysobacter]UJB18034.1 DoxX family protein [Lysobacter capsici]UJQ28243.1 DoxX family protein [Lysobacter gummosus]
MPRPSPASSPLIWMLRIVLAVALIAAGASKLAGLPFQVELFERLGFGQWFRYFTGATELATAALLLVPRGGFFGGVLLLATMLCAIAVHVFFIGGSPVPALVLGALAAFVAWRLRPTRAPVAVA